MARGKVHPIDLAIGKKIRERRLECGLSQTTLAEKVGVSFQQMQKYEKGSNRVAPSRLFFIAQTLGVKVGWFFEGVEAEGTPPDQVGVIMPDPRVVRAVMAIPSSRVRQKMLSLAHAISQELEDA